MIFLNTRRKSGFTLVEALVAISIISILSVLLFSSMGNLRRFSDRSITTNNLRQIGQAIQLYIVENDGTLPGPLLRGHSAWYKSTDQTTLGYRLWSYLGAPPAQTWMQEATIIQNPANTRYRQKDDSCVYILNPNVTNSTMPALDPFGYKSGSLVTQPAKYSLVSEYNPSQSWALQDMDQKHPLMSPGWSSYASLPKNPVHGNVRITLFFDWHVEGVSTK